MESAASRIHLHPRHSGKAERSAARTAKGFYSFENFQTSFGAAVKGITALSRRAPRRKSLQTYLRDFLDGA